MKSKSVKKLFLDSKKTDKHTHRVFIRDWWRKNPDYPDGLEPCAGPKSHYGYATSERIARKAAQYYNKLHDPGELSRKAEYEKV